MVTRNLTMHTFGNVSSVSLTHLHSLSCLVGLGKLGGLHDIQEASPRWQRQCWMAWSGSRTDAGFEMPPWRLRCGVCKIQLTWLNLRKILPTMMSLTPPSGFLKAVSRPNLNPDRISSEFPHVPMLKLLDHESCSDSNRVKM